MSAESPAEYVQRLEADNRALRRSLVEEVAKRQELELALASEVHKRQQAEQAYMRERHYDPFFHGGPA